MRIGIDAGGTFTDFVVLADDGTLSVFKLRSDPADPASVILAGIERATAGLRSGTVEVIHGSTVATNALLERKGVRTAFITSPGFRDLLAIGRQNRTELYSLLPAPRTNLVPGELCFEWHGDPARLRAELSLAQPRSAAICLLGAFRDATVEQTVEQALEGAGLYVCRSSEIAPEFREYERASTTVLNAYVGPLMDGYLSRLESECPHPIHVMQSNGGRLGAGEARRHAVRTILSGPAGGVVGARAMAHRAGWPHAIAFDMGGTSTDVSLVEDPLRFATEAWIEGLPVRVPMLDIHTVGAGGGSIASVDAGGRLRVGPESAGSRPGPACYGTGALATVTDAHVVLGRILPGSFLPGGVSPGSFLPGRFLDGSLTIDPQRAERAVSGIAQSLGLGVPEAAAAIIRIANSNMERAIRVVSVEKGRDPREFPLVAFGGCGGLHACEIAEELGMETVVFPAYAGALSALGMLLTARTRDFAAGALEKDPEALFAELETRAGVEMPEAACHRYADIRYRGQSYELTVDWNAADPRVPFENAYERIYGARDSGRPIEVVTARVRAVEGIDTGWFETTVLTPASEPAPTTQAQIFAAGSWHPAVATDHARVETGLSGPALILDYGSTVYLPGGWRIARHANRPLVATR